MHRTGLVTDSRIKNHDTGLQHPEAPDRITAVLNQLERTGVSADLRHLESREATDDDITLVHGGKYLELVKREIGQGRPELSTGDTLISADSLESARVAAGCVLSAVDAVFSRAVSNAFCVVRPPGHHASANRGMGFCIFNNVAIGARYARRKYGVERVLIADWDVHHGNGTQDIFYEDGSVLFFSTHQSPWYPWTGDRDETGEGEGAGKTLNYPFPSGAGIVEIHDAFQHSLIPAAEKFRPDLIMLSAGFDSRIGDPLGEFRLMDKDFRELTGMLMDLAGKYTEGRVVSVLEGGYNLDGLARAAEAHVRGLLGVDLTATR